MREPRRVYGGTITYLRAAEDGIFDEKQADVVANAKVWARELDEPRYADDEGAVRVGAVDGAASAGGEARRRGQRWSI